MKKKFVKSIHEFFCFFWSRPLCVGRIQNRYGIDLMDSYKIFLYLEGFVVVKNISSFLKTSTYLVESFRRQTFTQCFTNTGQFCYRFVRHGLGNKVPMLLWCSRHGFCQMLQSRIKIGIFFAFLRAVIIFARPCLRESTFVLKSEKKKIVTS